MVETKKGTKMKCVCETQGMKENKNNNNKQCEALMCDEEKDENEENHTMLKDNKSYKMSNEKESSNGVIHNENCKCEENESLNRLKS